MRPEPLAIACPDPRMIVLVANRGEIARRVIRTVQGWGARAAAVYAEPDVHAPHVTDADLALPIGPAALEHSYLSIDSLLAAADAARATHVHPGYGFLAERADFADAVTEAGLVWVGPSPEATAKMGSKIEARTVAEAAGVPVIPGYNASQDDADLAEAAERIGFPVLVKASAGGGGKGIRIAWSADEFAGALSAARTEAERSFGDGDVIVERYITRPRHIEVQVCADKHGNVADLGTRECSVQRRYQKVLEEAPAPNLPADTESAMRAAAVDLARSIGYDSVGTVECILDDTSGEWFFLEMNTRIQVEHTVTEEITGVDLVALQLAVASGEPLPIDAETFGRAHGSSIEARINAENPWGGFVPDTGTVTRLTVPEDDHIRWDAAVVEGSVIGSDYDSMIGKLVVHGPSRGVALDRMAEALRSLDIEGVSTTIDFHRWLVAQPAVRTGMVTTRFLDETPLPPTSPLRDDTNSPWATRHARRFTPHRSELTFASASRDGTWADDPTAAGGAAADITSPFPGLITEVHVAPGDEVHAGQTLAVIEAMKMLHPIVATGTGTVATVDVEANTQVVADQTLITFHPPSEPGDQQ